MSDFYKGYYEDHCFAHHGILGQKWGIRRYQNPDGSLTEEGKSRARRGLSESVRAEGKIEANEIRRKSNTASKAINFTAKTAAGVGGTKLATKFILDNPNDKAYLIRAIIDGISDMAGDIALNSTGSYVLGNAAAYLAGFGSIGAAGALTGAAGAALVGIGTKAIGNIIKKHGELKASELEVEYSSVADAMKKEFSSDDEDRKKSK